MKKKYFIPLIAIFAVPLLFVGVTTCQAKMETNTLTSKSSAQSQSQQQDLVEFKKDSVQIKTQDGEMLNFYVELATTPKQRAQGLMFRRELAENEGMLFVWDDSYRRAFWMKNTFIPLDMLFLHHDGHIHHIHHNAKPQDLTRVSSELPSMAVMEIPGGLSDRIGIKEGDQVLHPLFKNVE